MAGLWICGIGLVWFGLVFYYIHTSILACLHGLNATNEVVMCFFLIFSWVF